jgi:hypothetical protein
MIVRLVVMAWIIGALALALVATSQTLFSTRDVPNRSQLWISRISLAAIWPVAIFSPAGRDRLRSLFKF